MEDQDRAKPVYVTFAAPPSDDDTSLIGFFWEFTKLFGRIAQKFNPLIAISSFFIAAFIAHSHGLGLWSFGVGFAVAAIAWLVGGALIYWSVFSALALAISALVAYLLYLFGSHITS